jgi:tetratricopeptide (TPR) repeat protein
MDRRGGRFLFVLSAGEEPDREYHARYHRSRMGRIGRFGCMAILACPVLAGESAGCRFDRYREAVDRCHFLVSESRTREAENSCREAVKLADRLPAMAKRERIDANSLTAQVYLDLGLPEDALRFAGPASTQAQTSLPSTDTLRGRTRYQLARCYEGLGRLDDAEQNYRAAVRDLDAAVRHAGDASKRQASTVALRNALQSYRQLLSAEGKSEQAAGEPAGKP